MKLYSMLISNAIQLEKVCPHRFRLELKDICDFLKMITLLLKVLIRVAWILINEQALQRVF